MQIKIILQLPIIAAGIIAAAFAITGFILDAFNVTNPAISAYCKVDGFAERTYGTFSECDISLKADIEKYGYVCRCSRSDGVYSISSTFLKWFM